MRAQIIGTGSCLPEKIVTNDFLSTIVDTSDEWISSRTGIRQRHIAVEETTASMSTEAGRRALESAGVKAEELDLIIVATCTPDTLVPNTACLVQSELGAVNAVAFDISAACSGFVFVLRCRPVYIKLLWSLVQRHYPALWTGVIAPPVCCLLTEPVPQLSVQQSAV